MSVSPLRYILGGGLAWITAMIIAVGASWIDQIRMDQSVNTPAMAMSFALGFAPWLVLFPAIFVFAERDAVRLTPFFSSVMRSLWLALSVFGFIMAYALFVYAPTTGQTAARVLLSQQFSQWLWDASFFVLSYLSGRLYGQRQHSRPASARLAVRSPDRVDFVPFDSLIAVTGQGNYAALICSDREILHRATLSELETLLAPHGFCRIHRSHLVRPLAVISVRLKSGRVSEVLLPGGHRLPVSETHAPMLGKYLPDAVQQKTV